MNWFYYVSEEKFKLLLLLYLGQTHIDKRLLLSFYSLACFASLPAAKLEHSLYLNKLTSRFILCKHNTYFIGDFYRPAKWQEHKLTSIGCQVMVERQIQTLSHTHTHALTHTHTRYTKIFYIALIPNFALTSHGFFLLFSHFLFLCLSYSYLYPPTFHFVCNFLRTHDPIFYPCFICINVHFPSSTRPFKAQHVYIWLS